MKAQERFDALSKQPLVAIGSSEGKVVSTWASLRGVLQHRQMLGLLVRRDIKSRYKDSSLGFIWALVRPLTQLAIYYIVLGKILGAERGIPEFAIYVYTGLTAYGLFSEIVAGGTSSIVTNAGLIKKIYLPREVFPLASVGSALFNFLVQLVILIVACFAFGSPPFSKEAIYFLPALAILLIWATAFAILLSAVNVYLRDVQYLVEVVVMLLMWASPIVYSWKMVTETPGISELAVQIYTNNPITLAILGFQRTFWISGHDIAGAAPGGLMLKMVIAILVGVVFLFISQRVFAKLQGNFAQEL